MNKRLLRYWTYFRRGHNTYLVFLLSFANFVVIQYRLLITYIPLKEIFDSLTLFAISFFILYVPLATIIGWYDYKKFAVPIDNVLLAQANPYLKDLAQALIYIANDEKKKAIETLEKWIK